jgi:hypothetical protein
LNGNYEKPYVKNNALTGKMNNVLDYVNGKCIIITRGNESHTSMDILFIQELNKILKESGLGG